MLFTNLHFLRPWWFLTLVPLALLSWRLWRFSQHYGAWQGVVDAHLLPYLMQQSQQRFQKGLMLAITVAWLLAILALTGPSWQRLPAAVYRAQHAQVIVLDLSIVMEAADIKPNRITRARYKILDILNNNPEAQIGLVVFSGEPYVVSPLTEDAKTIAAMVPVLNTKLMPITGQNIGAALTKASDLLKQADAPKGQIILMTASQPTATDIAIAKKLYQQGFSTSVLGVGTLQGAPIPASIGENQQPEMAKLAVAALQQLARAGGGIFEEFSNSAADIDKLLAATKNPQTATVTKTKEAIALWRDDGFWLILPLLLLVVLVFRRGWFMEFTR